MRAQSSGIGQALLLAAFGDPRGAEHARLCLARIGGPIGERCRELHRELCVLDPASRRAEVAALARLRDEPLPPDWRDELSAYRLPAALALQLPRLLARSRAASERGQAPGLEGFAGWSSARLQAALHMLGVLVLAALLRSAPELRAPLQARLAAPVRGEVEAALAAEPISSLPRHLRAAPASDDLPLELALQLLAPLPAPVRARIAQVLPAEIGARLLASDPGVAAQEPEPLCALLARADRRARGEER